MVGTGQPGGRWLTIPVIVGRCGQLTVILGSAAARDLPDARIVVIAHPLGGVDEDTVRARAASAVDAVRALITPPEEA